MFFPSVLPGGTKAGKLTLWNLETMTSPKLLSLTSQSYAVTRVVWSTDGQLFGMAGILAHKWIEEF